MLTRPPANPQRLSSGELLVQLGRLAAPFAGWMALAVLLGAATIASNIGLMATSALIIASAALHPSIADLAVPIVGVRFFGIARGVFRYLERLVSHQVNFSLLARLRVWFYTAIEPLAPRRLVESSYHSGDLLSRIVGDIETLQNVYVRLLAPPLVALAIAIGMGLGLAGYSFTLALVVLACMVVAGVVLPAGAYWLSRDWGRRLVLVRSDLNVAMLDGLQGSAVLAACGREQQQSEHVRSLSNKLIGLQTRMAFLGAAHNATGNLVMHLALWLVLLVSIPLVTAGPLSGVHLSVLALAVPASFEAVLALPGAFQYLESNLLAARRLFEIAAGPTNPVAPALIPSPPAASAGIRVQDLCFHYDPDDSFALDHVSFDVAPGGHVAIVGPSGAGKTTIANLLLRFWDYDRGHVTIGGRDLCEIHPETARRYFGVVSQATHLFNTTIRQNLLLARPDASEEEMVQAARQAQVHDFVASLPSGYDTWVGEQGLKLSGGERQRLAIARALLKDAPILLLDEPTVHLDATTERQVWQALVQLMPRRTTLVITHRLVGLEDMDEVLVLRAGRVVERGTHHELLAVGGLYRRMWELQIANCLGAGTI